MPKINPEGQPEHLLMPRDQAEKLISQQIEEGRHLLRIAVNTEPALRAAERHESQWLDYNVELLRRILSTDLYAKRYETLQSRVYGNFSLAEEVRYFRERVQECLTQLESDLRKLPIIPEAPSLSAALPGRQQAPGVAPATPAMGHRQLGPWNHPQVWVAMIGAVAAITVAYLQLTKKEDTAPSSHGGASVVSSEFGKLAGTLTLEVGERRFKWRDVGMVSETKTTGNHHCARDCEGEPTRTSYTLAIDAGEKSRLSGPTLLCIGGPCEGWHSKPEAYVELDGKRAVGSVDVWSHPTTWRLTAKKETLSEIAPEVLKRHYKLYYGKSVTISIPKEAASANAIVETIDNNRFVFPAGAASGSSLLELAGRQESGNEVLLTYAVRDHQ